MRRVSENIVIVSMGISISDRGVIPPGERERVSTCLGKGGRVNERALEGVQMQLQAELNNDYEQCLARDVLAGDTRAILEFEELLRAGIYNLAKRRSGSQRPDYECRDLIVDVITYLIMGLRQTKGGLSIPGFSPLRKWLADPRGNLVGFCLTSARNYLIDLSRIREISTEPLPDREMTSTSCSADLFTPPSQEDDLFTKELRRAVQDVYQRLPGHERKILMLKYHLGITDAAIGLELGISETMARKRRNQAEDKFWNLFVSSYGHIA